MTEPMQSARSNPEASETAAAIGAINVIVPTEVPIAVDTKHATTNNTDRATADKGSKEPRIAVIDGITYSVLLR